MGIIYRYTNLLNGKSYIGQTINPEQRLKAHKSSAFNENSAEYNTLLHQAMRKYGYENFAYEVLAEAETIEELNGLEIYFIAHYKTLVPNGYNIEIGGNNAPKPKSEETKIKLMQAHAELSEDEVIALRLAYQNRESPSEIYNEKYQNRMQYASFMNIWTGARYKTIMPEVFKDRGKRATKLTEDLVRQIRLDRRDTAMSYQEIADKYLVSKACIADICKYRTWKHVQI